MQMLQASSLVPSGFAVETVVVDGDNLMIAVRPIALTVRCPACEAVCDRVHSQYRRTLADLPAAGRRMVLVLRVRRFFCDDLTCRQRIFGERFDGAIQPRARRTARLDEIVYCLAIALGGRPAASLARRIGVAVSNDTLLRVVRRHGVANFPPPLVVGIDDWAWRRNHRYGSLICDLERRKTIALLPDRESSTAEAWMRNQPQIVVVARDRGGSYAVATQRALPEAIQVADRWHLMENVTGSQYFILPNLGRFEARALPAGTKASGVALR